MFARGRAYLGNLGLLLASLLATALILEILLQVGAAVVQVTGRAPEEAFATDSRRIVCLGDSNTYGLYLEREQAYPQQLEDRWNATDRPATLEVLNLGYPGTNSSTVLREFPRILETLTPNSVILMVGSNDFWTSEASEAASPNLPDRVGAFLRARSRLYRIYAMLRNLGTRQQVVAPSVTPDSAVPRRVGTIRYGDHAFNMGFEGRKKWAQVDMTNLVSNLRSLVTQAEAAGTSAILMTYPSNEGLYGYANPLIRRASMLAGAPLVDLNVVFSDACPDSSCESLFFSDGHPTALGYELVADTLVERISTLLEHDADRSPHSERLTR